MSSQFKPFRNDWLTHTDLFDRYAQTLKYQTNLDVDFFKQLNFDSESLLNYRIDAAIAASKKLGSNPVLCFSGGVDSQAMVQSWLEAKLKFSVAILKMKNEYNKHDYEHALLYCDKVGIEPVLVEIDVITFLTRENHDYGIKYRCSSPHFNTHYRFFDKLRDMGYTGICGGGTAFAKGADGWGPVPTPAQMNYVEYARLNNYPMIGNFLGYDPKLCWTIALLTPPHDSQWVGAVETLDTLEIDNDKRYVAKVKGYQNHGFDVIPQSKKFTGFEKVKDYFAEKYKDGWTFEKKFRYPLEKLFGSASGQLLLTQEQTEILDILYNQNGFSS